MSLAASHALYFLGAIVAVTLVLIAGVAAGIGWFRAVFRAWDNLGAALAGGDGMHSISAYCGRAIHQGGPAALAILGTAVDLAFGEGHCVDAARREGLIQ